MALRETIRGPVSESWSPVLAGVPRELWEQLRAAGRRLLLLDYDGTLAPFHVHRDRAQVPPRVARLVRALAQSRRTSLALISGRPIEELERLLGDRDLGVHWIGEHGWEERAPRGEIRRHALSDEAREGLEGAWKAIGARGLHSRIERKRTGLVLHTRGLFPDADLALRRAAEGVWLPWTERAPLRLDPIHGGLELRAEGRDKGRAALDLHRRSGELTMIVYVGDDESDEDAFRALADLGYGIRVGRDDTPTQARGRLPKPEAMDEFLSRWLDSESMADPADEERE
ncbi:MAG TPA: trehalose-phosphatase [Candidatus Eisenbacteria bacterium]|nr:trehalose-phosphatase [Candidatus Eisenbacteria bacterium]